MVLEGPVIRLCGLVLFGQCELLSAAGLRHYAPRSMVAEDGAGCTRPVEMGLRRSERQIDPEDVAAIDGVTAVVAPDLG